MSEDQEAKQEYTGGTPTLKEHNDKLVATGVRCDKCGTQMKKVRPFSLCFGGELVKCPKCGYAGGMF